MRLTFCLAVGLAFFSIGCTTANPDYPDMSACTLGERRCDSRDRAIAMVCGRNADDRQVFLEEPCPLQSLCDSGRCLPPSGARTCQNFSDCAAGEVCTVLVSSSATTLATYCVPAQPGAVDASMPCTKDTDCATYRCLQQTQGKFCMKACGADGVCGGARRCLSLSITVTGVQGQVQTCSAP